MERYEKSEFYCDLPFNMLVMGMTDCGKSYFVLDLLENEFLKKINDIIIFCPTIQMNKTYQDRLWIENDVSIYIYPSNKVTQDLNECLKDAIDEFKSKDSQTLFIIDDCANLWESKNKCTKLTELAFHGRHFGISVWLLTQKYNAICKDFRENCKHMVIHTFNDQASIDQVFKENRCIPHSEKDAVIKQLDAGKRLILRRKIPFSFCIK